MAYRHIDNLYKNQDIFLFRECYAMEKIHGTSAHVTYDESRVPGIQYYAGGCSHEKFVALFDSDHLSAAFRELGHGRMVVYGEAHGGKLQGMSDTYGKELRFVAFEVKIGDSWLAVPQAEEVAHCLGLDFVHYVKGPAAIEFLDEQRDAPSVQAKKNGIEEDRKREGIVIRPLIELRKNNGDRIIVKYKAEEFRETRAPRPVSAERLKVLEEANAVAAEWVTEMRLTHVLDGLGPEAGIERTGDLIRAMIADIEREGKGEVIIGKEACTAIGRATAQMFKARLKAYIRDRGVE